MESVVLMDDDTNGRVSVIGRYQDASNFYELQLRRDATSGAKGWWIYRRVAGVYALLASGAFDYVPNTYYRLKLAMKGSTLTALTSHDSGVTWTTLGATTDTHIAAGKAGLKSQDTAARFDKVEVESLSTAPPPPPAPPPAAPPGPTRFGHVVFVVLENHSYSEIIGNPLMPYYNGLANQYASATQFWPNVHPSQPNYFIFTTGNVFYQTTTLPAGTPNVVASLRAAGKSWKAYFETTTTSACTFRYLPEVAASSAELAKIVTVTQFDADVANGTLPAYSMVHPSTSNSGHSCANGDLNCPGLQVADNWLKTHLDPYIKSPGFIANNDLLLIGFDEGDLGLQACNGPITIPLTSAEAAAGAWTCGDHAPLVLIGPGVKPGYKSTTLYHDESIPRVMLEGLGITSGLPAHAATAASMAEFFR
jgi:acid phosphatase